MFLLEVTCKSSELNNILYIFKNVLKVIMIATPILVILCLTIGFFKMMTNPDEKKLSKGILNITISLIVVFFIPLIVNTTMHLAGDKTDFSACYNNAKKIENKTEFIPTKEENNIFGLGENISLDYSCSSNTVKSKFSCTNIKIVENHQNDFNVNNFESKMQQYGGYKNYLKSLGGVYSTYADYNGKIATVSELQAVSEYVWGIMTMWGFDYCNYKDSAYSKWGDSNGTSYGNGNASSDAFYPNGVTKKNENSISSTIDEVASGKGNGMTTNCALGVQWTLRKAGILPSDITVYDFQKMKDRGATIITNSNDLMPGDIIHYFTQSLSSSDKQNPSVWWSRGWFHIDMVGERDDAKKTLTLYDSGHYYTNGRDYKLTAKIGEQKVYPWATDWVGMRITNLK